MTRNPIASLRALLLGGVTALAKIGSFVKDAGPEKVSAVAAALIAAATAAMLRPKWGTKDPSQYPKYIVGNIEFFVLLGLMLAC